MGSLVEGNTLKDRYKIVEVQNEYADLTIYKAKDMASHNSLVYIREIDMESKGYKTFSPEILENLISMLSTISHRCLPKFIEYHRGMASGYIIEEYITGQTLAESIEGHAGPYDFREAYNWMMDLCDLIQYLHSQERQIILRGLTPQVIKITPSGDLKVISLDKARFFNPAKDSSDTVFVWNPGYTSPEQYGTQKSDVRADVYGFGAVFYYAFTKQNLGAMHFNFPPISQFNPKFTPEQDAIFAKCLDKDVYTRYQSIYAVKNDLMNLNPFKKKDEEPDLFEDEPEKEPFLVVLKKNLKAMWAKFIDWLVSI